MFVFPLTMGKKYLLSLEAEVNIMDSGVLFSCYKSMQRSCDLSILRSASTFMMYIEAGLQRNVTEVCIFLSAGDTKTDNNFTAIETGTIYQPEESTPTWNQKVKWIKLKRLRSWKSNIAPFWCLYLLMLLQSSQVLCQWRGHRCRDKLQVILGFPPINCSTRWPLVLPKPGGYRSDRLLLQVSFLSSIVSAERSLGKRNGPLENKWKLPSASLAPGGRPLAVAFGGYISYFLCFCLLIVLWLCCQLPEHNLPDSLFFYSFFLYSVCCSHCHRAFNTLAQTSLVK